MNLLRRAKRIMTMAVPAVLVVLGGAAHGQVLGAGPAGGMNAALTWLFGPTKAFTAKAEVRVLDAEQKQAVNVPMDFALLDEWIRIAVDVTQMKNRDMPSNALDQLKSMGMDQVVSIIRPDRKLIYMIYPKAKVLTTMPMTQVEAESARKKPKMAKTPLGKESIDGHACVKNKVVLTPEGGEVVEATTWEAGDLKDFPVQIETKEAPNTSIINFKQIQFEKPDAKLFEPPAGYTEYKDQGELMQAVVKKMMDSAKKK